MFGWLLSGLLMFEPAVAEAQQPPPPEAAAAPSSKRWRFYRRSEPAAATLQSADGQPLLIRAPDERGTGLLAVAGILGTTAAVEHGLAVGLFNNTCGLLGTRAMEAEVDEDATEEEQVEEVAGLAGLGVACGATVAPALMLRLSAPLLLGGSLGMASWGAAKRARSDAFRDRFIFRRKGRAKPIVYDAVGGSLLAVGVSLWLSSRITLLDNRTGCDGIRCYTWYDFGTLHASAAMSIAGAAVLTYGRVYGRQRRHYREIEALHVAPTVSRESVGFTVGRRF
ncbi:MAG: hypothetical protein AAGA54_24755 [Myxococcota bacterium]